VDTYPFRGVAEVSPMIRWFNAAGLLLLIATPGLSAAEQRGTVRKVDASRQQLTIDVSGTSRSYEVAKDASIVRHEAGDKKKAATIRVIEQGVAGVPVNSTIEFLTEQLGGKPMITSLKVTSVPVAAAEPKKKSAQPKKPPKKKKNKKP